MQRFVSNQLILPIYFRFGVQGFKNEMKIKGKCMPLVLLYHLVAQNGSPFNIRPPRKLS